MDVKIILSIVGALISLAAVVLIYNARKIVRERFSFTSIFYILFYIFNYIFILFILFIKVNKLILNSLYFA